MEYRLLILLGFKPETLKISIRSIRERLEATSGTFGILVRNLWTQEHCKSPSGTAGIERNIRKQIRSFWNPKRKRQESPTGHLDSPSLGFGITVVIVWNLCAWTAWNRFAIAYNTRRSGGSIVDVEDPCQERLESLTSWNQLSYSMGCRYHEFWFKMSISREWFYEVWLAAWKWPQNPAVVIWPNWKYRMEINTSHCIAQVYYTKFE